MSRSIRSLKRRPVEMTVARRQGWGSGSYGPCKRCMDWPARAHTPATPRDLRLTAQITALAAAEMAEEFPEPSDIEAMRLDEFDQASWELSQSVYEGN